MSTHHLPTVLLITLLLGLPAARADETQDAIDAIRAKEIARASDPDGTQRMNLILGTVVLPAGLVFLLYFVAKGRR